MRSTHCSWWNHYYMNTKNNDMNSQQVSFCESLRISVAVIVRAGSRNSHLEPHYWNVFSILTMISGLLGAVTCIWPTPELVSNISSRQSGGCSDFVSNILRSTSLSTIVVLSFCSNESTQLNVRGWRRPIFFFLIAHRQPGSLVDDVNFFTRRLAWKGLDKYHG